jgi:hypothetical protein
MGGLQIIGGTPLKVDIGTLVPSFFSFFLYLAMR